MTTCPRCQTYCFGDCQASERRTWTPRARTVTRTATAEPKIQIGGVVKTRSAWEQRLAEDVARLDRITNAAAREVTEQTIAQIRAALA